MKRRHGSLMDLPLVLMLASLWGLFIAFQECIEKRAHTGSLAWYWWLVAGLGPPLALIGIFSIIFWIGERKEKARQSMNQWHGVTITHTFDEAGFTSQNPNHSNRHNWKEVTKVQITSDTWLVFLGQRAFGIPATALNEELRQLIIRKVHEAGGVVTRER